jgi:excisionase family DNA binding protein
MDIELPGSITPRTLDAARAAALALRAGLAERGPPEGVAAADLIALLTVIEAMTDAATEDAGDLSPSQTAERLATSRPSVMRLIARGDLPARKDGGHYWVAPRDVRAFQTRIAAIRREAMADLVRMTNEFGF